MVKATPILAAFCAAMPLTSQEATADDWVIEPTYGFFKEAAPTSGANPGAYFGALYYDKQTAVIYTCEAYFASSLPNPQDNFNCYRVDVTETPTVPVTVVPGVRFFPTAPTPCSRWHRDMGVPSGSLDYRKRRANFDNLLGAPRKRSPEVQASGLPLSRQISALAEKIAPSWRLRLQLGVRTDFSSG
jgi:hypothetical protein